MIYSFCVFIDWIKRVDIYLSALFSNFSRSYIQKMIDKWQVEINWKTIIKNTKIKNKDEITLEVKLESLEIKPENMNLDIIFEDSELLVINKDSNVNVHPVPWEDWKTWTLVNGVLYHCKWNLPWIWWIERPWIVHRLDKDTSWVILVAKSDKMMLYLSEIIKDRKIDKYYIAIVYWLFKDKNFKIESYIWRHPNDKIKMTTKNPINPKLAITYWETIWYIDNKYSVLKIKIETWRTHQIRVHLSSIWFPIIWDRVYWNFKINEEVKLKYWLSRQALHAYSLEFELYWKKQKFTWELKPDIKKIIWNIII